VLGAFNREHLSGAGLLAGGLAYRFFLWLVPFGLLLAALCSFWVRLSARSLETTAKDFGLGGVAAHSATAAVEDGSHARWYLLVAGLLLMMWAGAAAVRALRVAAFIAWQIPPDRLRRPLHASAAFFALAVLDVAASTLASWARHNLGGVGLLVTVSVALVYAGGALFALAKLPHPADVGWRDLLPGALLVGCGFTAIHVFTAYYLAHRLEQAPDLYGALGASTTVLLILYLIARLIVSSMFLNAALNARVERGL
jgi:uncharacterized BrkB/YihY/UPF0761 family membrane protein